VARRTGANGERQPRASRTVAAEKALFVTLDQRQGAVGPGFIIACGGTTIWCCRHRAGVAIAGRQAGRANTRDHDLAVLALRARTPIR
jgi:hypothetical protein